MSRVCGVGLLILAAAFLAVGQAPAAETLPGEPEIFEFEAARETAPPSDEPLAAGRIVAIDRTAGRVTLEFRPIPQLLLEGGRRVFRVENPALVAGLAPGDKVRFEVRRQGRSYTITRIVNSN
jgi:Cu/Ag efflux protein CusF